MLEADYKNLIASNFPLVEVLLSEVIEWRNEGADWNERYKGVTNTTKELLGYWFENDHETSDGEEFKFYAIQRLGIETLIFIVEILKADGISKIFKHYWNDQLASYYGQPPKPDEFSKFCFKMATGTGKTFIMILSIIWSYFNYINNEPIKDQIANSFLIIAPNKIVYKRLKKDILPITDAKSIFNNFPFIPPGWENRFDLQIIYRSDLTPIRSKGIIFLTNIQQLYAKKKDKLLTVMKQASTIANTDFDLSKEELLERSTPENPLFTLISSMNNLMVINDEAHHVHSDYLAWNRTIIDLNKKIQERNDSKKIKCQLDFSATPRYQEEQEKFFEHIIIDYSLSKAVHDQIVKVPKIGNLKDIPNIESDNFAVINQYQIQAGIRILKEYEEKLNQLNKKSILFIMADKNVNADKVYRFILDNHPNYSEDNVLLIHTIEYGSNAGELSDKDEEELMDAAENIDNLDNPYKIIISVMMLKEGWDVRSVKVIVPLRAYGSDILVEQTLGRGLRKQFQNQKEYLTVIEHERFADLIKQALKDEGLDKIEIEEINASELEKVTISELLIYPLPSRLNFDLEIPILLGGYSYQKDILQFFDWDNLSKRIMKIEEIIVKTPKYYEQEFGKDEILRELDIKFSFFQNINDLIVYLVKYLFKKFHLSGQIQNFLPKFKKYLRDDFFDKHIDFDEDLIMLKLNHPLVIKNIYYELSRNFSKISIEKEEFQRSTDIFKISETERIFTSKDVQSFNKTIFNYIYFDSILEEEFAKYLDNDPDVKCFCKIVSMMKFYLYFNEDGFLKRYIPDFFVQTNDKKYYLIETKGEGFIDKESTKLKTKVGEDWAKKAGDDWEYLFVGEKQFYNTYSKISFIEMVKDVLGA